MSSSIVKTIVYLCLLIASVPVYGDELAQLACPGSIRKPFNISIPPEFERLKSYYEIHLTSLMRIFDGWSLPESIDVHFGAISAEGLADYKTHAVYFPALFRKYPSGKTTDPNSTLAGVIHEIGHLVLVHDVVQVSPRWKYARDRAQTIEKDLKTIRDKFDDLNRKYMWFTIGLDPLKLDTEQLKIYPLIQASYAQVMALENEMETLIGYYHYGFQSYQEVFADLVAVLYSGDLRVIAGLLGPREKNITPKTAEFRSFSARNNPRRIERWQKAVLKEIQSGDLTPHIIFGPARAEIGAIIKSHIKTEFGKRRAARALASAIASEANRVDPHVFEDPFQIPFQELNDRLVQAFQKAWDLTDRPLNR